MSRRPIQQRAEPVALAIGLLQDGGRAFFLKQQDYDGTERIGLPFVLLLKGQDPVAKLAEAFIEQTGIDGYVQDTAFESTHNVGSRKRKKFIPVIAFNIGTKNASAKPAERFTGYAWMPLDAAKQKKLMRTSEWLLSLRK